MWYGPARSCPFLKISFPLSVPKPQLSIDSYVRHVCFNKDHFSGATHLHYVGGKRLRNKSRQREKSTNNFCYEGTPLCTLILALFTASYISHCSQITEILHMCIWIGLLPLSTWPCFYVYREAYVGWSWEHLPCTIWWTGVARKVLSFGRSPILHNGAPLFFEVYEFVSRYMVLYPV